MGFGNRTEKRGRACEQECIWLSMEKRTVGVSLSWFLFHEGKYITENTRSCLGYILGNSWVGGHLHSWNLWKEIDAVFETSWGAKKQNKQKTLVKRKCKLFFSVWRRQKKKGVKNLWCKSGYHARVRQWFILYIPENV